MVWDIRYSRSSRIVRSAICTPQAKTPASSLCLSPQAICLLQSVLEAAAETNHALASAASRVVTNASFLGKEDHLCDVNQVHVGEVVVCQPIMANAPRQALFEDGILRVQGLVLCKRPHHSSSADILMQRGKGVCQGKLHLRVLQ